MTNKLTKETTDGERLRVAMADATSTRRRSGNNGEPWAHEWQQAATEFAAPYLARIATLEAENKTLREAAAPKRIKCNSCRVEMWDSDPLCPNCGDDQEDRGAP
jgi:hypothetical protein